MRLMRSIYNTAACTSNAKNYYKEKSTKANVNDHTTLETPVLV